MSWPETLDLVWRAVPALALSLFVTAVLLIVGWLLLVEGLQGSDHVVVHIYEVFFQGKDIEDRDLSEWRIIFGTVVTFAGVLFFLVSMLAILTKTVTEALTHDEEENPEEGPPDGGAE